MGLIGFFTGIGGSVIGKLLGFFEERQKFNHQVEMLKLTHTQEMALYDAQAKLKTVEAENEARIVAEKTWGDVRVASYQMDVGLGKPSKWVANTLRLVRPVLTLLLVIGAIRIFYATNDLDTQKALSGALVELATMAISWWFGDRAMSGRPERR